MMLLRHVVRLTVTMLLLGLGMPSPSHAIEFGSGPSVDELREIDQRSKLDEAEYFLHGLPDLRRRLSLAPHQHLSWYDAESSSKTDLRALAQTTEDPVTLWKRQLDDESTAFGDVTTAMLHFDQSRQQYRQHFVTAWLTFESQLDSAQKTSLRRYWQDWLQHCQFLQQQRQETRDNVPRGDKKRPAGPAPGGRPDRAPPGFAG